MAKVFITQDSGRISFEGARRYGELVPLVKDGVYPDNAESRTDTMAYVMWSKLKHFNERDDFLLLTGDPVAIALAVRILGVVGTTQIQLLKYDRDLNDYYKVTIV